MLMCPVLPNNPDGHHSMRREGAGGVGEGWGRREEGRRMEGGYPGSCIEGREGEGKGGTQGSGGNGVVVIVDGDGECDVIKFYCVGKSVCDVDDVDDGRVGAACTTLTCW